MSDIVRSLNTMVHRQRGADHVDELRGEGPRCDCALLGTSPTRIRGRSDDCLAGRGASSSIRDLPSRDPSALTN